MAVPPHAQLQQLQRPCQMTTKRSPSSFAPPSLLLDAFKQVERMRLLPKEAWDLNREHRDELRPTVALRIETSCMMAAEEETFGSYAGRAYRQQTSSEQRAQEGAAWSAAEQRSHEAVAQLLAHKGVKKLHCVGNVADWVVSNANLTQVERLEIEEDMIFSTDPPDYFGSDIGVMTDTVRKLALKRSFGFVTYCDDEESMSWGPPPVRGRMLRSIGKLRLLHLVNDITGDFEDGEAVEYPLCLKHVVLEDVCRMDYADWKEMRSGHVQLPAHLESLTVTADGDECGYHNTSIFFSLSELPKGLKTLTFRPTQENMFRGNSALESLPACDSLKHLLIDHAELAHDTPLMLHGARLPAQLQTLHMTHCIFDAPLQQLPVTLRKLVLNCEDFNCSLGPLPPALEHLELGVNFKCALGPLPPTLQQLIIGCDLELTRLCVYNHQLQQPLPPRLQFLKLGEGYKQSLPLPPHTLERIELGDVCFNSRAPF
jgi:hypothetical protein